MAYDNYRDKVSRRNFLAQSSKIGLAASALAGVAVRADSTAPGARLSDAQLLDLVQRQTLKYFVDFAHPVSGMARECNRADSEHGLDTVTTGGTGFGIMGIIAGTSRGWLTRKQSLQQLTKIVDFLSKADHYHGIFPHWLNGTTGKTFVYPGSKDDGADLVETSFLMMGLLTARQYFNGNAPEEKSLRESINALWERADWKWHTQGGNELYWHWSPNHEWEVNLPIKGWNEALITHVLAASSPTHGVSPDVYHKGWATGADFTTRQKYKDMTLPLGPAATQGGPLFIAHYSFLGLSPLGLKDQYADYSAQNLAHTLINRDHCIQNPKHYEGYGPQCWGLTSSCNHLENGRGYSDHSPANDLGVIAPTAALSSFPYTPDYSMAVLRHLYEDHPREKIWGEYGFVDAFKSDRSWYSDTYLAIDQGPIIAMIENHRSGLLWDLFMSCPEVHTGLKSLGFETPYYARTDGREAWKKRVQGHAESGGKDQGGGAKPDIRR